MLGVTLDRSHKNIKYLNLLQVQIVIHLIISGPNQDFTMICSYSF